ncbi:hypothetical protein QOZ80_1AG0034970 [Eleusine coracana subsp. coracana]|nr:hypothetical protein QOZ80_1AG0034970 [Eleusine coracana subsp. coracana]
MAAAAVLEDEESCSSVGITLGIMALFLVVVCGALHFSFVAPEFWVKVEVKGLDRSASAVTAPTFNITLRVNSESNNLWRFCGKGGSVVVAYANVPLAHGEFPEFCVPPGVIGSVPIVATGEGLGLPDDLYDRMESQRQRGERVTLAVHVKLREVPGSQGSPVLLWCTAVLHGQPEGPFVCPVIVEGMVYTIYAPVL